VRIEVPFTAGVHAVIATYDGMGSVDLWHHTWSYRAAECITGMALTRAINAEGDALFGHGGRVHVRLECEEAPR
jgi:hypothetical protein